MYKIYIYIYLLIYSLVTDLCQTKAKESSHINWVPGSIVIRVVIPVIKLKHGNIFMENGNIFIENGNIFHLQEIFYPCEECYSIPVHKDNTNTLFVVTHPSWRLVNHGDQLFDSIEILLKLTINKQSFLITHDTVREAMSEYFHGEIGDKARRSGDAHMVLILEPQSVFKSMSTT